MLIGSLLYRISCETNAAIRFTLLETFYSPVQLVYVFMMGIKCVIIFDLIFDTNKKKSNPIFRAVVFLRVDPNNSIVETMTGESVGSEEARFSFYSFYGFFLQLALRCCSSLHPSGHRP